MTPLQKVRSTMDEELVGRLKTMSAAATMMMGKATRDRVVDDVVALLAEREALNREVVELREALEKISGAALYRTRTGEERVCLASATRVIARTVLTRTAPSEETRTS